MLDSADRDAIVSAARRHQAKRVLIFGSALSSSGEAHDIDMGVEGVPPSRFFDFYADVMFSVSKPVDIVDLSVRSSFTDMVRREGKAIYLPGFRANRTPDRRCAEGGRGIRAGSQAERRSLGRRWVVSVCPKSRLE